MSVHWQRRYTNSSMADSHARLPFPSFLHHSQFSLDICCGFGFGVGVQRMQTAGGTTERAERPVTVIGETWRLVALAPAATVFLPFPAALQLYMVHGWCMHIYQHKHGPTEEAYSLRPIESVVTFTGTEGVRPHAREIRKVTADRVANNLLHHSPLWDETKPHCWGSDDIARVSDHFFVCFPICYWMYSVY
jgi:hypothetical protein